MQRLIVSLLVLCMVTVHGLSQEERILHFDVEVEVNKDRSVIVTEHVEVYVAGLEIKRGITRSLPTSRSLNGNTVKANYKILDVKKNGQSENYHKENSNGHLVLYLGDKDILLSPGVYKYTIKYRANDQIGFFEDYDEIYWNAIGNDVRFKVEEATCRVHLPEGAGLRSDAAYIGQHSERGTAYTSSRSNNSIDYQTTRALDPGEAFTIAVGFDKGIVNSPSFLDRLGSILTVMLGSIFLLPYLVRTWYKHGIDPPTPPSYPLWDPPNNLSSASVNYLLRGGYDKKSFTASIVHLAITGHIEIEEITNNRFLSKRKNYNLIKTKDADQQLAPEESDLLDSLFRVANKISISGKYDKNIERSLLEHKGSLSAQHQSFIREGSNLKLLVRPILYFIVLLSIALILLARSNYATDASLGAILAFGAIGVFALMLYGYLIKKPTPEKLDLKSRIKGFKMYLELAEKDRLQLINPPDMNPGHYEAVLPYAFALGVEHKWTKKFKEILEQAQYKPEWNNSQSTTHFSRHFGNEFSKSVGAATTKPTDSKSGSSGGGFAGGGGGGGGVGGW